MQRNRPARKPRSLTAARPRAALVAAVAALLLLTLLVFLPLFSAGFINLDDPVYVTENSHVRGGLSLAGARWAATSLEAANWHPLTWLSHMADVQVYGMQAPGHHATNLLLHGVSAVLLLVVLQGLTGMLWPGLLVAALFAVHPLHVESVAWVAERKDVLAGLFWMLTLGAYLRYVRRPGPGRYAAVLIAFALGLMSKPMLVTLPAVLLLLDFWPLGRLRAPARPAAVALEKLPLFLMAAGASALTMTAQGGGNAVVSLEALPVAARAANAVVAAVTYLGKSLWPSGLAVFYPFDAASITAPLVAGAAAILLAGTLVAAAGPRFGRPYLTVGWLWFLGTLVPVIGLVQVGSQSRADRYTYLPLVGIFLLAAWEARTVARRRGGRAPLLVGAAALAVVAALAVPAFLQAARWRDQVTLYRHSLAVTHDNPKMHDALGKALLDVGANEEAALHLREALRIKPTYADGHGKLGTALARLGRRAEALAEDREALRLNPNLHWVHNNIGNLMFDEGRPAEAIDHYREAVRLAPDYGMGHLNLGLVLAQTGRLEEAAASFGEALRRNADPAQAHYNLGLALQALGRNAEAAPHFREAGRLNPAFGKASR